MTASSDLFIANCNAIASTCDTLCKEIAGMEMGDNPRDARESVVDIVGNTFKLSAAHAERDHALDLDPIPTVLLDLFVD